MRIPLENEHVQLCENVVYGIDMDVFGGSYIMSMDTVYVCTGSSQ